jgi:plastocyanin
MKGIINILPAASPRWMLLLVLLIGPQMASAQWHATVGAESTSKAHQALAFLPNEIWIYAGDTVTWTSNAHEIHTVSFLKERQVRPPFDAGCPGFASGVTATVDGTTCISTPPLGKGQKFTVTFPVVGNFKLVCLVHQNMTGVVHVLDLSKTLPHTQGFYDDQAAAEQKALLSDDDIQRDHRHATDQGQGDQNAVTVGIGEVVANGGGSQTLSIMRFMDDEKVIHVGETVEWTNFDPATPHTITFGVEPAIPVFPVNATLDPADGIVHGVINSSADSVHSGLIMAAPQDQLFLPTPPLGVTRFRVTFTHAGVFPYICALHDGLGMKGKVIVLP